MIDGNRALPVGAAATASCTVRKSPDPSVATRFRQTMSREGSLVIADGCDSVAGGGVGDGLAAGVVERIAEGRGGAPEAPCSSIVTFRSVRSAIPSMRCPRDERLNVLSTTTMFCTGVSGKPRMWKAYSEFSTVIRSTRMLRTVGG